MANHPVTITGLMIIAFQAPFPRTFTLLPRTREIVVRNRQLPLFVKIKLQYPELYFPSRPHAYLVSLEKWWNHLNATQKQSLSLKIPNPQSALFQELNHGYTFLPS